MKGFLIGLLGALSFFPATGSAQVDLESAIRGGHVELVAEALEGGADFTAPIGMLGVTPLHMAAIRGTPDVVRLLLDAGAPVDAKMYGGNTPLSGALRSCAADAEVIRLLVAAGADPDVRSGASLTPLHLAITHGRPDLAHLLVELGADPHAVNRYGDGMLNYAIHYRQPTLIRLALDRNVDPAQLSVLYETDRYYQIDFGSRGLAERLERCAGLS